MNLKTMVYLSQYLQCLNVTMGWVAHLFLSTGIFCAFLRITTVLVFVYILNTWGKDEYQVKET